MQPFLRGCITQERRKVEMFDRNDDRRVDMRRNSLLHQVDIQVQYSLFTALHVKDEI